MSCRSTPLDAPMSEIGLAGHNPFDGARAKINISRIITWLVLITIFVDSTIVGKIIAFVSCVTFAPILAYILFRNISLFPMHRIAPNIRHFCVIFYLIVMLMLCLYFVGAHAFLANSGMETIYPVRWFYVSRGQFAIFSSRGALFLAALSANTICLAVIATITAVIFIDVSQSLNSLTVPTEEYEKRYPVQAGSEPTLFQRVSLWIVIRGAAIGMLLSVSFSFNFLINKHPEKHYLIDLQYHPLGIFMWNLAFVPIFFGVMVSIGAEKFRRGKSATG